MLKAQILEFDRRIMAWHRSNETSKRLDEIPGVGPVLATALVASVADPQNRIRASAKAAGTLISMVTVTTKIDTSAEFQKNLRNWFEESSST